MRIRRVLALLVILLFSATSAMAAGFRLPEAGAKAMGMGFAFVAQADNPSAIYFNPAGLTQLEGQNVVLGVTYIRENGAEFTGNTPLTVLDPTLPTSETQKDLDFFVPNAYWTKKASPGFAYGVGLFVPFGLGQEYKDKNNSIFRNQITKIELMTFVINPTVAWEINDVLSVGVGIDLMYGQATLERTPFSPLLGGNLYNSSLEGDGWAYGYNFGLLLTPSPNWKVGFSYRSPFTLEVKEGDVEIRNISPAVSAGFFGGATSYDTKGDADIHMPATATFGVAYIRDRLTLEVDADYTFWSSYDSLDIRIKEPVAPVVVSTSAEKNWEDVVAIYVGAEYRVTDPLALRLGFRYDPSPAPAETLGPELPDSDRLYYSAGVGYKYRAWTFDLAYMYVDKKDRKVDNLDMATLSGFDGEWSGDAHLVALDVGYNF
jgi:long-chain fatty acid transport protein